MSLPKPPTADYSILPADLVERHYQGPARMIGLLAQGDFAAVQAYWDQLESMSDRTEQTRAVLRSLDSLSDRGLYLVYMAREWQQAHPESKAARLMLAASYTRAAYEGAKPYYAIRGQDEYEAQAYMRLVQSRLAQARPLLDELMKASDFYGMAARQVNLYAGFMGGDGDGAWNGYLELIAYAPQYEWLYLRAANYADAAWSGEQSEARFATLGELAKRNELSEDQRIGLWQEIDEHRNNPDRNPNPQAWRPYWQARVKAAPILNNYIGWMKAEQKVANWPAVLEISDKVLAFNPDYKLAWEYRSQGLRQMGRPDEAHRAAVAASLLGSSQAMEQIILAHINGDLARNGKDLDRMYRYCQVGASLALASAANCMGAAHSEAFAGVKRDDRDALRWHLLGARGGYLNSLHDVVVIMPRVINDPAKAAEVKAATGYWLRLAALYGHVYAKNKLQAQPDWGAACRPTAYEENLKQLMWFLRMIQ